MGTEIARLHKSALTLSSAARDAHREWIGGQIITLLSIYWRDDDDERLTGAIGRAWADVLEPIPQKYIEQACLDYLREVEGRKPTPAAIYKRASDLMKSDQPKRRSVGPIVEFSRDRSTPPDKAAADEILRLAGFDKSRLDAAKK